MCPLQTHTICMIYEKGYGLRVELKIANSSHLQVIHQVQFLDSSIAVQESGKSKFWSEICQIGSVTYMLWWVYYLMQKSAPYRFDILKWEEKFMESKSTDHRDGNWRPFVFTGTIEQTKPLLQNIRPLSARTSSVQFGVLLLTAHQILHKSLYNFLYELAKYQNISEVGKEERLEFAKPSLLILSGNYVCLSFFSLMNALLELIVSWIRKLWEFGAMNVRCITLRRFSKLLILWCGAEYFMGVVRAIFHHDNIPRETYPGMLINNAFQ